MCFYELLTFPIFLHTAGVRFSCSHNRRVNEIQSNQIYCDEGGTQWNEAKLWYLAVRKLHESTSVGKIGVELIPSIASENYIRRIIKGSKLRTSKCQYYIHVNEWRCSEKIFTVYMRPILEYTLPTWTPHEEAYGLLKRFQLWVTKIVLKVRMLSYGERLTAIDLPTLGKRTTRWHMIKTLKLLCGNNNADMKFYEIGRNWWIKGEKRKLRRLRKYVKKYFCTE